MVAIRIGDGAQVADGARQFDIPGPVGARWNLLEHAEHSGQRVHEHGGHRPEFVELSPGNFSVTGNGLSRSANGRFLVMGGYNTNLSFTSDLQSASATTVPRGIGLIDDQGQYTLAISSTNSGSGNFWRGAVADGTNNYWGFSRTSSTYYFGFDAPGVLLQSTGSTCAPWRCFNGSIYGVSAVPANPGRDETLGPANGAGDSEWL